ncbi:CDP-diacylglycerol--serine O-phosphatidyltransferase [Gammaproteobacteria bacterium 2W06]|nr:CDP-diacylglycerol--serine O-phosphatidyltransferase [Gammaproteobacteria bacterium 2W06]
MTDPREMPRRSGRGIYLLPNLITTLALLFGFYAVVAAQSGAYEAAAVAILLAMVMDGLDGRVARLTNTQTEFGVQYDSIADMVSFGMAPALVVFAWALDDLGALGSMWDKLGWVGAFIYTACAGLRLARFNTQVGVADKRYFQGLPSPAAAAALAGMVWSGDRLEFGGWPAGIPALVLTVVAGMLMVSNVRYDSFKEIDFRYRVPFVAIVLGVMGVALMSVHPPLVLFGLALTYLSSGPILTVIRRRRRRRRRHAG